jgi:hypothetical protein
MIAARLSLVRMSSILATANPFQKLSGKSDVLPMAHHLAP